MIGPVGVRVLLLRPGDRPTERCWAALADDERARAARYRCDEDRVRFAAARALLRELVGTKTGLAPRSVPLRQEPSGRVVLDGAGRDGPWFSVAHGGAYVLVALGHGPVGVDVEPIAGEDPDPILLRRSCTVDERRVLKALACEERRRAFTELWVRKEASFKAASATSPAGRPTPVELAAAEAWEWRPLDTGPGHVAAVVAAGRWRLWTASVERDRFLERSGEVAPSC